MPAADPRVSFAELCQWPDDGSRYELYDGEVVVVPPPMPLHQRVAQHLGSVLLDYERAGGGFVFFPPIDVVLSEYDVLQPDLVFFCQERSHLLDMRQVTRVAPDLVGEVLSRATERRDRGRKMDLLARHEVPEYWMVDPVGKRVEIYRLEGRAYALNGVYAGSDEVHSPGLPNLRFAVSRIFGD